MAERYSGTVASYNSGKGWGYIHEPTLFETYQKDVFLHRDYAAGQVFSKGDQVSFGIEVRQDGKPQARDVVKAGGAMSSLAGVKLAGGGAAGGGPLWQAPVDADSRHTGIVASFNAMKGWGYIKSPDLFEQYGKDVFLHRDYLDGSFVPVAGTQVSFELELREADSMPQARQIQAAAGSAVGSIAAMPPTMIKREQVKPVMQMQPMQVGLGQATNIGTVLSWNALKGWGYIQDPVLTAQFGKDVFLHRDYLPPGANLIAGDQVAFSVEVRQDGMPQARNIQVLVAGGAGGAMRGLKRPAMAMMPGPVIAMPRAMPRIQVAAQHGPVGLVHTGVIQSFNSMKGWGYIHCPELQAQYGKDVFLHKDYMEDVYEEGAVVSFTVEVRQDGKPQARNIKRAGGASMGFAGVVASRPQVVNFSNTPPATTPADDGMRHIGSILSYNATKGWGYIGSAELTDAYGKDVFLHKDYLEEGFFPETGQTVSFSIEVREDGKPQARAIAAEEEDGGVGAGGVPKRHRVA